MDAALRQNKGVESCDFVEREWEERFGTDRNVYEIQFKTIGSLMSRGKKPSRVEGVLLSSEAKSLFSKFEVELATA